VILLQQHQRLQLSTLGQIICVFELIKGAARKTVTLAIHVPGGGRKMVG
jgi:hypothetical protein